MGSLRFDGVRFVAYPQDHEPVHVHGFYAEVEVIVELREAAREVALAGRPDDTWELPRGYRCISSIHRLLIQSTEFAPEAPVTGLRPPRWFAALRER